MRLIKQGPSEDFRTNLSLVVTGAREILSEAQSTGAVETYLATTEDGAMHMSESLRFVRGCSRFAIRSIEMLEEPGPLNHRLEKITVTRTIGQTVNAALITQGDSVIFGQAPFENKWSDQFHSLETTGAPIAYSLHDEKFMPGQQYCIEDITSFVSGVFDSYRQNRISSPKSGS